MNKTVKQFFIFCLTAVFPALLFAQDSGGSLSFAPPPGDYSMQFLGNVFGQVDGTVYGTGSQLMGTIFGVFNSAVMALGGIVIMYTLMVSTMNTAQEGQLLGQKWSSIWIPIRSTVGLALLVPKASGYCMMQIFIMWVVVQGVGAADKLWDTALNYLDSGGSIVQANMNPQVSLTADDGGIASGATTMLSGQVCMGALQKVLENQRDSYMDSKSNDAGPCSGTPTGAMKVFCDTPVPDFVNTFNAVSTQSVPLSTLLTKDSFSATMPNFLPSSPYYPLNGICGTVTWGNFVASTLQDLGIQVDSSASWEDIANDLASLGLTVGMGNLQTIAMSRAIAVQQMYQNLSMIAGRIVNNMPGLSSNSSISTVTNVSTVATQPFGVPLTSSSAVCTSSTDCVGWGTPFSVPQAPILSGIEFQGAISNYNAIMKPALTLIKQTNESQTDQKSKAFINKAKTQGWIMAGSYFFDLVNLNIEAQKYSNETDTGSGLSSSEFTPTTIMEPFGDHNTCSGKYADLCTWLVGNSSSLKQVVSVINGQDFLSQALSTPKPKSGGLLGGVGTDSPKATTDPAASTVYGYIENAEMVTLPGQPGQTGPKFAMNFNFVLDTGPFYLKKMDFGCFGSILGVCIGSDIVGGMYNYVVREVLNGFLTFFAQLLTIAIQALLIAPLLGIALIFQYGVSYITTANVDPIVGLANMGVYYINFANDLWIYLIGISITTVLVPIVGVALFPLLLLALPFLMAWLAIMMGVGFITAYYIPFLPYMIFTFGSIAWLMAVIEAMVAAPIVALGVTHPEGNEAFGKGEQAIMLILNVFLRPSMMVIGFFAGIIMSYVAVWILNSGFQNVSSFMSGDGTVGVTAQVTTSVTAGEKGGNGMQDAANAISSSGYTSWAGIYAFFFSLLMYTTLYTIVVQKSFTLITLLPDKILRWIGGQPESIGAETAQWGEEAKGKVEKAGGDTAKASGQMDQQISSKAMGAISKAGGGSGKGGGSGSVSAGQTPESGSSPPPE